MKILGIETSCDETAAAIIETNTKDTHVKILSNIVASSSSFHEQTGGIIPEIAAREQIKYIIPVIDEALTSVKCIGYREKKKQLYPKPYTLVFFRLPELSLEQETLCRAQAIDEQNAIQVIDLVL